MKAKQKISNLLILGMNSRTAEIGNKISSVIFFYKT